MSPSTVKSHLARVLEKLGVDNRVQAATFAVREGLLSPEMTLRPRGARNCTNCSRSTPRRPRRTATLASMPLRCTAMRLSLERHLVLVKVPDEALAALREAAAVGLLGQRLQVSHGEQVLDLSEESLRRSRLRRPRRQALYLCREVVRFGHPRTLADGAGLHNRRRTHGAFSPLNGGAHPLRRRGLTRRAFPPQRKRAGARSPPRCPGVVPSAPSTRSRRGGAGPPIHGR